MYSPTTRLLTVLELLQSYKQMSGPEMARRLEIDVRTVRRYIVMLQDMGIPVEAERGPYGAYQLQRGHRLPPLMFTDSEAIALTLGLLAIREFRFPVDVAAVEGALAKTERVMPSRLLQQVRGLQEAITFHVTQPSVVLENDLVVSLSSAVRERQRVRLRYQAWRGETTERQFDPYGIVYHDGYWYAAGFCHLREDIRTFRLDRIVELAADEQGFERPERFDPLEQVLSALGSGAGMEQIEVILKTSIEQAQRVTASLLGTLEESPDGIVFRRAAYQLDWVAHFLITLDFPVVVVRPVELRDTLRHIAARALALANDTA